MKKVVKSDANAPTELKDDDLGEVTGGGNPLSSVKPRISPDKVDGVRKTGFRADWHEYNK
jgi:hypothetical protein